MISLALSMVSFKGSYLWSPFRLQLHSLNLLVDELLCRVDERIENLL